MNRPSLLAFEGDPSRTFRFRHDGQTYRIPGPLNLGIYEVLSILESGIIPGSSRLNLPGWKSDLLFERWCTHYDLPPLRSLQRLAVYIERYRSQIEVDLQVVYGLDLMALWRGREWRRLLNFIDHLPTNTWYHEAVVNDPEHVRQLVEAEEQGKDEGEPAPPTAPPLHSWSPELAKITDVLDAVKDVSWTIAASNSEKGKTPEHPKPSARPVSPLEAARKEVAHQRRTKRHKKLAARLLPHKYDSEGNRLD